MATYSIACAICHKPFATLLVNEAEAVQQMSNEFAVHISNDHRKEFKVLQRDMQTLTILATWYMLMQQATFLENKPRLDMLYEANGTKILELLGIDEEIPAPEGLALVPPAVPPPPAPASKDTEEVTSP